MHYSSVLLISWLFGALEGVVFAPAASAADSTPPSVTITAPGANDLVGGLVTVSANATDNVGVTAVRFFKQGVLVGSVSQPPYEQPFDFNSETAGAVYQVEVRAADAAGNIGQASVVVRKP